MDIEIIQNMYNYYDIHNSKYESYISKISYTKEIKSQNDLNNNIIEIYDNKNKKILKATYYYLGRYYDNENIWVWGWSILMHKSLNYYIKKIFDYGFNITIEDKDKSNKTLLIIKTIILNSIVKILNIDFILALSMYISKAEYIYNNKVDNYVNYYLLKDIEIL